MTSQLANGQLNHWPTFQLEIGPIWNIYSNKYFAIFEEITAFFTFYWHNTNLAFGIYFGTYLEVLSI